MNAKTYEEIRGACYVRSQTLSGMGCDLHANQVYKIQDDATI